MAVSLVFAEAVTAVGEVGRGGLDQCWWPVSKANYGNTTDLIELVL